MEKKVYFTEEELEHFKTLILQKLAKAKESVVFLEGGSQSDDNGTNDTHTPLSLVEEQNDTLNKEEKNSLLLRTKNLIKNLENSLVRIEKKTYGIDFETGGLMSKEFLNAIPYATTSVIKR